jgi:hypothetical protein
VRPPSRPLPYFPLPVPPPHEAVPAASATHHPPFPSPPSQEAVPASATPVDPKQAKPSKAPKPVKTPSVGTAAVPPAAGGSGGAAAAAVGDLARGVAQLACGGVAAARPSKALTSGRLLYVYSLDARGADAPNSLVS